MDTSNLRMVITNHANRTIMDKGFDRSKIMETFSDHDFVTDVLKYPGQIRLIGNGLALVGKVEGNEFILITVYLDRVLTPPRSDQLNTSEGKRYAERFSLGMGRG